MVAAGAEVIDVGGESTRPGAEPVEEAEELRRVVPVIESLSAAVSAPISIDTRKASVASAAIAAGASIVNDTSGEAGDASMDGVAAAAGAALILMHSRGSPANMQQLTEYDDVSAEAADWLRRRAEKAIATGVSPDAIVVDPGVGFAKTVEQSLVLLRRLVTVTALGYPVLVGTSRKSFIGAALDLPVDRRVEGTAATVVWAITRGAALVRVHDVEPIAHAVRMTDAIARAGRPEEP